MTGHKSTVSCLAVASGILYSGSWDGTIRSWWLTDHTPLSVLEDDIAGSIAPVLSISTEANFVVSSYENGYFKVLWNLNHESYFLATFSPINLGTAFPLILTVLFFLLLNLECLLFSLFWNQIWKNDVLVKSAKLQNGAIYAVKLSGKWLYSGGWDKVINIQVCLLALLI